MSSNKIHKKREVRHKVLALRDALSAQQLEEFSKKIFLELKQLPVYKNAVTIMSYLTHGSEVRTEQIIEESLINDKKIILPKTNQKKNELDLYQINNLDKDVEPGIFGIREPVPERTISINPSQLDLIIVPGVAFDLKGFRIGYGGGYYDRFLALFPKEIDTIGLAFEVQILKEAPINSTDQAVDLILTEKRLINPREYQ